MTIALSSGVTLTLTPTADARISRITTQTLAGIKVGDQVSALGQTEADGTFTASAVGVNWTLGGFGGRGRRGPGGGRNGGGQNGGAPGPARRRGNAAIRAATASSTCGAAQAAPRGMMPLASSRKARHRRAHYHSGAALS